MPTTVKYIGKAQQREISLPEGHIFIDARETRYAEVTLKLARQLVKQPDFVSIADLPTEEQEAEMEQAELEQKIADASGVDVQEAAQQAPPSASVSTPSVTPTPSPKQRGARAR